MRKNKLHAFSLIVGSILALTIAFSQFLTPQCGPTAEKVKTEQSDDSDTDKESESYISLPTFSLPVPVNVQANLDAYCLFEIFFEEENDVHHVEENLFYTDRLLETIFTVIISPNAP